MVKGVNDLQCIKTLIHYRLGSTPQLSSGGGGGGGLG